MATSASDHAPIAPKAARGMHDGVVHPSHDATKASTSSTTTAHGSSSSPSLLQSRVSHPSTTASSTPSPSNAFPPPSVTASTKRNAAVHQKNTTTKPATLAHQAALHRINALTPTTTTTATATANTPSESLPTTQPVLVTPAPAMKKSKQKPTNTPQNNASPRSNSPPLPSSTSFTFPSLLSTLHPEADAALDAIAEICGRSKLALADAHTAHLPPQGEVEALPIARMETLSESRRSGVQTRAMARRLAMANSGHAATTISGDATAATSSVVSHAPTTGSGAGGRRRASRSEGPGEVKGYAALVPLVLSWLRGEEGRGDHPGGGGAAGRLRGILDGEVQGA